LSSALEAFYLDTAGGPRFCVLRRPAPGVRSLGAVLYLHPFAEEMNKSRRMAALGATALAEAGWTVLAMDLQGCGDSAGEFRDASWQQWVADGIAGLEWLAGESAERPWLWGLRAGALLASQVAAERGEIAGLLLWQPVLSGNQHLTQFLRLKVAGEALGEAKARGSTQALRDELAANHVLEIAGYELGPALASGLDAAKFVNPPAGTRVVWGEASSQPSPDLSPASRQTVTRLGGSGLRVDAFAVQGPAFWQSVEIEESPALVEETVRRMSA
jgi:exosortase A-associated hydrolase 2